VKCLVFAALLAVWVAVPNAYSATYKCTDAQGKLSFSDRPCEAGTKEEKFRLDADRWVERIDGVVPVGVELVNVTEFGDTVLIEYQFFEQKQSNEFVSKLRTLSKKSISFIHSQAPVGAKQGKAKLQISTEPSRLPKDDQANTALYKVYTS